MLKILLSSLVFYLFAPAHPFYMSVCDLKYNGEEKALQGTVKIFTGDLEDALARINHKRTDLIKAKDDEATRAVLSDYLKAHLEFSVNDKPLQINVLGFEREEEAIWVYAEFKNCPSPKKIHITNKILCDFLPQQLNIVHIQVDTEKSSLKSSCENPVLDFSF